MTISELRQKFERKKGTFEETLKEIERLEKVIDDLQKDIADTEIAQAIIQKVAKETQQELEYHISELCSLAMSAIFDDPYEVKIEFTEKRGRTEADIYFERDGERISKPLRSSGGGAVDVAAFALRMATWSLSKPRTRNVMILDEPFQHLKGDEPNQRAIQMVKEISDNLDLQVIMISDERVKKEEIVKGADRVFYVDQKNKVSKVEVL